MTGVPSARQEQIIQWLRENPSLSVDELVARLGVSVMTVHRDLDVLARAGLVEKVHGGVSLSAARAAENRPNQTCALCDLVVSPRTTFILWTDANKPIYACCPHCGILLMQTTPLVVSALTRDFIYGHMVNVRQAAYVVEGDITLCCVPSVLCFARVKDAARFQQGFGGSVMNFEELEAYLVANHYP